MFSWTIDYRRRLQRFTQDLNRLSPFNPLDCFAIHFETILIRFVHVSGFRSISGLLSILHWRGFFIGRRPGWNIWMRLAYYIKWLRVACSAICSTNHCHQSVVRISFIIRARNRPVVLWEGDLSLSKVYKGSLGYAEGSPLTLCNHFVQLYRLIDTLVSEYY